MEFVPIFANYQMISMKIEPTIVFMIYCCIS